MENSEQLMEIWNEIMEENKDIFEADADKIFAAMEIAFHCHDLSRREGLLELEEYIDRRCGMNQDEVPLWEYLKPTFQIVIGLVMEDANKIWMLVSLFYAYHYTGYQALQACVYLMSAASLVSAFEKPDRVLEFFRTLVPEEAQAAFDGYFQPILEQGDSMSLKKITDLSGNAKDADILILEGDVILEPLEQALFRWNGPGNRNEDLEFEKAFRLKCRNFTIGIRDCTYTVHGRKFTDLSCMKGENAVKINDGYELQEYADGKKFLFHGSAKPIFDSGDREWDSREELAVYFDEDGVNIIHCSYGYKIPRIDIFIGLQKACRDFERFMEYLQCPDFGIHFDTDS